MSLEDPDMADLSGEERFLLMEESKRQQKEGSTDRLSTDSSMTEELDNTWEFEQEQKAKVVSHQKNQQKQKSLIDSTLHSPGTVTFNSDRSESDYQAETDVLQGPELEELLESAFHYFATDSKSKKTESDDDVNESSDPESHNSKMEVSTRELSEEQTSKIDLEFSQKQPSPDYLARDKWDAAHVKMPCSPAHTTTIRKNKNVPKWPGIQSALTSSPIISSKDLIDAIQ